MDESLIEAVRRRANHACEYCLLPQALHPGPFEVEHVIPRQLVEGVTFVALVLLLYLQLHFRRLWLGW